MVSPTSELPIGDALRTDHCHSADNQNNDGKGHCNGSTDKTPIFTNVL